MEEDNISLSIELGNCEDTELYFSVFYKENKESDIETIASFVNCNQLINLNINNDSEAYVYAFYSKDAIQIEEKILKIKQSDN